MRNIVRAIVFFVIALIIPLVYFRIFVIINNLVGPLIVILIDIVLWMFGVHYLTKGKDFVPSLLKSLVFHGIVSGIWIVYAIISLIRWFLGKGGGEGILFWPLIAGVGVVAIIGLFVVSVIFLAMRNYFFKGNIKKGKR